MRPSEEYNYSNKNQRISNSRRHNITCNARTIRPTLPRVEIHDNYNRGNKVISMLPTKIFTVSEMKINCTSITRILKPQIYEGEL